MNPEAIEAAAKALYQHNETVAGEFGATLISPPADEYDCCARAALEAAAPYLIREARAAELEAAAESIYRQARVQLRSSDGSRWQLAHRSGYADGVILARQELRARAAAIRSGEA